jgi:hypothetical protein
LFNKIASGGFSAKKMMTTIPKTGFVDHKDNQWFYIPKPPNHWSTGQDGQDPPIGEV